MGRFSTSGPKRREWLNLHLKFDSDWIKRTKRIERRGRTRAAEDIVRTYPQELHSRRLFGRQCERTTTPCSMREREAQRNQNAGLFWILVPGEREGSRARSNTPMSEPKGKRRTKTNHQRDITISRRGGQIDIVHTKNVELLRLAGKK